MLVLLAGLILFLRLGRELPLGRTLHGRLVEAPVHWALTAERREVLFVAFTLVLFVVGADMVLLLGSADLLLVLSWNLSVYFDALLVGAVLALATQVRLVSAFVRGTLVARLGAWRH